MIKIKDAEKLNQETYQPRGMTALLDAIGKTVILLGEKLSLMNKKVMKKNYTHIEVVLDRSGSMSSIRDKTIDSFNEFISKQKAVKGKATVSLRQFDDEYQTDYEMIKIKDAEKLNQETYQPRGMTALLDAIGKTVILLGEKLSLMNKKERPERVIFCVQTDGMENSSKEFSSNDIQQLIKTQEKDYNWQFVFLGAGLESVKSAISYGFSTNKSATYSKENILSAVTGVSCLVSSLRSSAVEDMSSVGYTEEHRKNME